MSKRVVAALILFVTYHIVSIADTSDDSSSSSAASTSVAHTKAEFIAQFGLPTNLDYSSLTPVAILNATILAQQLGQGDLVQSGSFWQRIIDANGRYDEVLAAIVRKDFKLPDEALPGASLRDLLAGISDMQVVGADLSDVAGWKDYSDAMLCQVDSSRCTATDPVAFIEKYAGRRAGNGTTPAAGSGSSSDSSSSTTTTWTPSGTPHMGGPAGRDVDPGDTSSNNPPQQPGNPQPAQPGDPTPPSQPDPTQPSTPPPATSTPPPATTPPPTTPPTTSTPPSNSDCGGGGGAACNPADGSGTDASSGTTTASPSTPGTTSGSTTPTGTTPPPARPTKRPVITVVVIANMCPDNDMQCGHLRSLGMDWDSAVSEACKRRQAVMSPAGSGASPCTLASVRDRGHLAYDRLAPYINPLPDSTSGADSSLPGRLGRPKVVETHIHVVTDPPGGFGVDPSTGGAGALLQLLKNPNCPPTGCSNPVATTPH